MLKLPKGKRVFPDDVVEATCVALINAALMAAWICPSS